jgi:hypothetical protein
MYIILSPRNTDINLTVTPSSYTNISVTITPCFNNDVYVIITPSCKSDNVRVTPCNSDICVILTFSYESYFFENFINFSCSSVFLILPVRASCEHFH